MNDQDLEQAFREWAAEDADVTEPAGLHDRVMLVPEEVAPRLRAPWLAALLTGRSLRGSAALAGAVAVLLLVVVVVPGLILGDDEQDIAVAGATFIVAQDGGGDFSTISEAVAAAADGDTIEVGPGVYAGGIWVTKDITIRGVGDRAKIIIDTGVEPPDRLIPYDDLPFALRLDGVDATVANLTIRGPASIITVRGGSPSLEGLALVDIGTAYRGRIQKHAVNPVALLIEGDSTALVRDSEFTRASVGIEGSAEPTLQRNELTESMVYVSGADAVIKGNVFRDPFTAIRVDRGGAARIEDNEIIGSESSAAWLRYVGDGTVMSANVIRDGATGILIVAGAPVVLSDNAITGNEVGLTMSDSDSVLTDNRVSGNRAGIVISYVERDARPRLEGNMVEGNDRGISVLLGARPTLSGNTVCGNGTNLHIVDGAEPTLTDNEICPDIASVPTD